MKQRRIVNQPPRGNIDNPYCRARLRAGLTQNEACQKLHISPQVLSGIENDKYCPTPDIVVAMARLYRDYRLPKKICYEICAIGRARIMPLKLNFETVIPMLVRQFDEIQGILNQLPFLFEDKESVEEFSPSEWELFEEYVGRIRKFVHEVEIFEASLDQMIEKIEKKTACVRPKEIS